MHRAWFEEAAADPTGDSSKDVDMTKVVLVSCMSSCSCPVYGSLPLLLTALLAGQHFALLWVCWLPSGYARSAACFAAAENGKREWFASACLVSPSHCDAS